jgi:glycerol kinase
MARNDWVMQFLADILDLPVERPVVTETTALGAAYLAGLAVGFWQDEGELSALWQIDRRFEPARSADWRAAQLAGWQRAVQRSLRWAEADR